MTKCRSGRRDYHCRDDASCDRMEAQNQVPAGNSLLRCRCNRYHHAGKKELPRVFCDEGVGRVSDIFQARMRQSHPDQFVRLSLRVKPTHHSAASPFRPVDFHPLDPIVSLFCKRKKTTGPESMEDLGVSHIPRCNRKLYSWWQSITPDSAPNLLSNIWHQTYRSTHRGKRV